MCIKSIIFILYCIQNCLSYPLDDGQDNFNNVELSPKFLNDIPTNTANIEMLENFKPSSLPAIGSEFVNHQDISETVPYANQFAIDYPDNTPTIHTNHFGGGDRPFVRPPRPRPPPDDVEVFTPPEQPRPPRPLPPGRPIPQDPNYGPFWPTNGRPVNFPKEGALREGHIEILPVFVEKEQFPITPERVENNMQILPESMRNEPTMMEKNEVSMSTIMAAKPNPIVLTGERERPQMVPVILENEPVRMNPIMMEKLDTPTVVEDERSKIAQFMDARLPEMASSIENKGTMMVERESPNNPMLIIMEKEASFMKPVQHPQMTPFTEIRGFMTNERRDPSEFIRIPQELPERFKRNDDYSKSNNLETIESSSNSLDQRSIAANEITKNEGALNSEDPGQNEIPTSDEITTDISATSQNSDSKDEIITDKTLINFENIPIASPQPLSNESEYEISITTSTPDSKKLELHDDIQESSLCKDSSTTLQPLNNEIQSTIRPFETSTALGSMNASQPTTIADDSVDLVEILHDILNDKNLTNNREASDSTELLDRQSIDSNEIMKDEDASNSENADKTQNQISMSNENTASISATSQNSHSKDEIIKDKTPITLSIESIPIASSQPLSNESDDKISITTGTPDVDSKKLELYHDVHESSSHKDSSITVQPPNNETQSTILPFKTSSTLSSMHTSQSIDSINLAKILDNISNIENSINNQETSDSIKSEISSAVIGNATEDFTNHPEDQKSPIIKDKHPIDLQNMNQPALHDDTTKKPPLMNAQINIYHHHLSCNPIECIKHQMTFPHELPLSESFLNIPSYFPKPQSNMNYNELNQLIRYLRGDLINPQYGSQNLHNLRGLYGLSQLYPINDDVNYLLPSKSLPMSTMRPDQYQIPFLKDSQSDHDYQSYTYVS